MARFLRRRSSDAEPDRSAREWMHLGADLLDTDLGEAETCYRRALSADPQLRDAWFDLGLVHKWRQEWEQCLDCNRRAAELAPADDHEGNPAYWNAGIAATALHRWDDARWAWRGYGLPLTSSAGPVTEDFGLGVVRLPEGETVWGARIDPARMTLLSVPLPESGFRRDDIVLHDGSPEGSRVAAGREYPVFDVLARWQASATPTVEVIVDATPAQLEELRTSVESAGMWAENWTESVRAHCIACSMGRVDYDADDHDHPTPESGGLSRIGCSGDEAAVREIAGGWASATGARILSVETVG